MDLSQSKLSKSEWQSVEIPVSEQEKRILALILEGYSNPDIRGNGHQSLIRIMKVESSEEMEYCLYKTYFAEILDTILPKKDKATSCRKIKPPNKADQIRIQKLNATIESKKKAIFDFVLLDYFAIAASSSLAKSDKKQDISTTTTMSPKSALYTLIYLRKLTIPDVNRFLLEKIDDFLKTADTKSADSICDIFSNSTTYIERNRALMEYADEALYSHQRDLFDVFSNKSQRTTPKCVLYMAPTGTGKTLSPIGLSQEYRVLYVCAARHVGLALAKSAISVGKRVAFAFGCETASDIRLHYFAAADYTINKRSGGIYKVDNSNGVRVEIMICDVASYLVAMYYMKSFHSAENIITYWDEPTIGLDREDEELTPLHNLIHRVWSLNQIPNMVLSCATLPKPDEIGGALQDFRSKFAESGENGEEPEIHIIDSHDCKKTISLLNKEGKIALPHLLFADYSTLIMECVDHCDANRSLLRYFDVAEIVRFTEKVQSFLREDMRIAKWFKSIDTITLQSIKLYYLAVLRELPAEQWKHIYEYMTETLKPRFHRGEAMETNEIRKIKSESHHHTPIMSSTASTFTRQSSMTASPTQPLNQASSSSSSSSAANGILLTTADAHTLTDGPTIYLAEDIEKIGRFYIQQSKIPDSVFSAIQQKIDKNNLILKQVKKLEQEVELKMGSAAQSGGGKKDEGGKSLKKSEKEPASKEVQRMLDQIQNMRMAMQTVHLNSMYIPNTKQHQDVWVPKLAATSSVKNAFVPNVDEEDVREIMGLDVENQQKLLLILGIGVFSRSSDSRYAEIMKRLAYEQRLFLIIASSDYIYGTNYQFCHGFIGKDLTNMTQQKTIQAIGRIGRNNIQQEYTVRFRDDGVLERLFRRPTGNLEAVMMNRLFCSDD